MDLPIDTTGSPPRDSAPPRSKRRFLIWGVVVLVSAGLLYWVLRADKSKVRHVAPPPTTVAAATAQRANVPVYRDAIGIVTPIHTALINSQVNGQVITVHYKEGQHVKAGTPLIEINPRPFAAALLQAQGALERDRQILAQAKMDLDRFRAAWAKNAIARQQFEDQEKIVKQAEGTVMNDEGLVAAAQVQLDFCHITSPFAGRVGLRLVDPGNIVNTASTTTLAVITQLQPISVVFTLSEDALTDVLEQTRAGSTLVVEAYDRARTKRLATGTLITIDNQIDTTTGTVKLRAQYDNKSEELFPNQFVNTRLLVRTLEGATIVPSSAVQHDGTKTFVYVIENSKAQIKSVKTGVVEGETTQIVEGIGPGAIVANSSFDKLRDGAAVTIGSAVAARGSAEKQSTPP
ncbi:putative Co/Zn/Cd efflux system membrane fusion protein [Labilithrix luteola]|uniref:Putative Co/Zn/Cd efflux system membrane fusion protein n=1 Tax=Labilithrix luteola TaxID=1391654 RepID=A0A0K1PQU0_9BACT|nr:efflux RND transporter periplasmic adaptor subunit [Labilithrix luteola]AKU95484.1 putative Co/Zn/Cd efflux system membrane fusion protein [Labilithrix luteola]